jgi:hypothetical protein
MTSAPPAETTLDSEAFKAFVAGVRGPVLQPGDDGYDDARAIWNGLIDRRPALIVRCTGAADVVDAVTTSPATPSTTVGSSSTCRR